MDKRVLQGRHFAVVAVAQHFEYGHLPAPLAEVSKRFHDLAEWLIGIVADDPQLALSLHELLAAKDCAVRAARVAGTPGLAEVS